MHHGWGNRDRSLEDPVIRDFLLEVFDPDVEYLHRIVIRVLFVDYFLKYIDSTTRLQRRELLQEVARHVMFFQVAVRQASLELIPNWEV